MWRASEIQRAINKTTQKEQRASKYNRERARRKEKERERYRKKRWSKKERREMESEGDGEQEIETQHKSERGQKHIQQNDLIGD